MIPYRTEGVNFFVLMNSAAKMNSLSESPIRQARSWHDPHGKSMRPTSTSRQNAPTKALRQLLNRALHLLQRVCNMMGFFTISLLNRVFHLLQRVFNMGFFTILEGTERNTWQTSATHARLSSEAIVHSRTFSGG